MIFKRLILAPFCTTTAQKHHLKITEIVKRMDTAQETLAKQQEDIKALQQKVPFKQLKLKEKEELNKKRNNEVHQMRVRLTEDIKKAEQIWTDAKKQIERNKSEAINSFAKGLIKLGDQLNKTSQIKSQHLNPDLKEGFDLTSRLFYTSLEKYNIKLTELKENDTVKKGEFQKVGEEKADKPELKGKVAKVVEQGWSVEGKLVRLPKVIVYA